MVNNNLKKQMNEEKLIDPDVTTLLSVSFGGLGGIGGIYAAAQYIKGQTQERINKEKFNRELRGFTKTIANIEKSIHKFQMTIENLENLIITSNKRKDGIDLLKERVRFGNLSLLLREYEFERYKIIQSNIYNFLQSYNNNLLALELFLQDYPIEMQNENRYNYIAVLENLVKKLNLIHKNITYMSLEEFLAFIMEVSMDIMKVIELLKKSYIDIQDDLYY